MFSLCQVSQNISEKKLKINLYNLRRMEKSFLLKLCFLLFAATGMSQNLFPDPGFEEVTVTQKEKKYYYQFKHWARLLPIGDWGNVLGLPKFSIYQALDTFGGKYDNNWNPHTGDSYFIYTFPHTPNLIFTELIQPLKKDSLYHFEIFQKVFVHPLIDSVFVKGQIGVWFTNTDFRDPKNLELLKTGKIKYKPHIWIKQLPPNAIQNDLEEHSPAADTHNNYHPYRQTFTPDREYKYAVLGNHQPFMEYGVEIFTERKSISYRLDDIYIGLRPNSEVQYAGAEQQKDTIFLIYFESNSSKLSTSETERMEHFFSSQGKTIYSIQISGHTDRIGSESANESLSRDRAEAVANFLRQNGFNDSMIHIQAFGKSKMVASGDSETAHAKNRRVEMVLKYLSVE